MELRNEPMDQENDAKKLERQVASMQHDAAMQRVWIVLIAIRQKLLATKTV